MKKILLILCITVLLSGCVSKSGESAVNPVEYIAGCYDSIDFSSDFKQGNINSYDFYKEHYLKLLNCEKKINIKNDDSKYFLDEYINMNCSEKYDRFKYKYILFDMDNDSFPELYMSDDSIFKYIIKYNADSDEFVLWHEISNSYTELLGSEKLLLYSGTSPVKYAFYRLDESGDIECTVMLWVSPENDGTKYMLTLPEYRIQDMDIPEYMKKCSVEIDSHSYYEVNKEQWDKLTEKLFKAKDLSRTTMQNMELSYYDLFPPENWQDAYRKQLLEFMESEDYFEHSAFSIYDISEDGIPELIISQDTSHAASCFVYGYNGETILIEDIKGCYGTIGYYEDNNIISVYNLHQGYEFEGFYKIQDYQLVLKDKFFNNLGAAEKGTDVYEYNNQQVSREEYEEALKNCKGEHGVELGVNYGFDEIDKAFEECN